MVCGFNNPALRRHLRVEKIKSFRAKRNADSSDGSSSDSSESTLKIVDKKEARRIRNRESAVRSREKITDGMDLLRNRVEELERENAMLKYTISQQSSGNGSPVSYLGGRVNTSSEPAKF
jgi:hypothetical protein